MSRRASQQRRRYAITYTYQPTPSRRGARTSRCSDDPHGIPTGIDGIQRPQALAIIAFVMADIALLGGFTALVDASTGNDGETPMQVWGNSDVGVVLLWALVRLVFCGLLVWGGLAALRGKIGPTRFSSSRSYSFSGIVVSVMDGSPPGILACVGLILQCVAFWLIRVRQSKEFFSAQGGPAVQRSFKRHLVAQAVPAGLGCHRCRVRGKDE